jgi:SHR-binding domain of vacuolar-sorting associated protein 13
MPYKHKAHFKNCFKALHPKKNKLEPESQRQYDEILYICDENDLKQWAAECLKENREAKNKNRWARWWGKAEEPVFHTSPRPEESTRNWERNVMVKCPLIELRIYTYGTNKELAQSEVLSIKNLELKAFMNQSFNDVQCACESTYVYSDHPCSQKTILSITGSPDRPGITLKARIYNEITKSNEIEYVCEDFKLEFDMKLINNLLSFISLKGLSVKDKKEVLDKLAVAQESAMNQISDIFYYEKTYTFDIILIRVLICVPAGNGVFKIEVSDLRAATSQESHGLEYSGLQTSLNLKIEYDEVQVVPRFTVNGLIKTLSKKHLKIKWTQENTSYDQLNDLEFQGDIDSIHIDITPGVISEFLYIQKTFVLQNSADLCLIDKDELIKECGIYYLEINPQLLLPAQNIVPKSNPKPSASKAKANYSLKIKDLVFRINAEATVTQSVSVEYNTTFKLIKAKLLDMTLWKDKVIISPMNIYYERNDTTKSSYLNFPKAEAVIEYKDILYFKKFFDNIHKFKPASKKLKKAKIELAKVEFLVKFISLKLTYVTPELDPLFQIIVEDQDLIWVCWNPDDLYAKAWVNVSYYNPLLQIYEYVLEPICLGIKYNKDWKFHLEVPNGKTINFIVTDFMISHLISIFNNHYEPQGTFSVYNNTGCRLYLTTNDGFEHVVEEGHAQKFQGLNEDSEIDCTVILSDSKTPKLHKVPLFTQKKQIHELDKETEILTEIVIVNHNKQLKISSPLEIKNETALDFYIAFGNSDNIKCIKECVSCTVISIPLYCLKDSIAVIFMDNNAECNDFWQISCIKKDSKFIRSGESYLCLECIENTIYIRPSLIIINYLPCGLFISSYNLNLILPATEKKELYLNPYTSFRFTINLYGYEQLENLCLFSKPLPERLVFTKNKEIKLEIGCFNSIKPNHKLILYPLLLLVNLSALPLEFHIKLKDSIPSLSEDSDQTQVLSSPVDFILVKLGPGLSEPIDIKDKLCGSFEIPVQSTSKHQFVYNIFISKVPEEEIVTKVVTIESKIIITNMMDLHMRAIQHNQSIDFTFIRSGQKNYFNWHDASKDLYMSIKLEVGYNWSGPFLIDRPTSFYLQSHTENPELFIKVEIKEEDYVTNVIFYESYETDFKIENFSRFDIYCYQKDYMIPLTVQSMKTSYFAWTPWSARKLLILEVQSEGMLHSETIDFDISQDLIPFEFILDSGSSIYGRVKKESNTLVVRITDFYLDFPSSIELSPEMNIKFPEICFSIVQQELYNKKEILLVSLLDIEILIKTQEQNILWELGLSAIQADSQIYEYVEYPIILLSVSDNERISCSGQVLTSNNYICFDKVVIKPSGMVISMDTNSLSSIINFTSQFKSSVSREIDHYLNYSFKSEAKASAPYIFLSKFEIKAFDICISFKLLSSKIKKNFFSYLIDFKNINLTLNTVSFINMYCSAASLLNSIIYSYKKMILDSIPYILKQRGIIGEGINLFLNLSGGINNLKGKYLDDRSNLVKPDTPKPSKSNYKKDSLQKNIELGLKNLKSAKEMNKKSVLDKITDAFINPADAFVDLFKKKNRISPKEVHFYKYSSRPPRVFYGKLGAIKEFNFSDSETVKSLIKHNAKYLNYKFYGQAEGIDLNTDCVRFYQVMFFCNKIVFVYNSKIIWKMSTRLLQLDSVVTEEYSVVFRGITKKKLKPYVRQVDFRNSRALDKVLSILKQLSKDISR